MLGVIGPAVPRITWIVLAAGSSARFGGERSKLLEEIGGLRVIDVTFESIAAATPSADVILISNEDIRDACEWTGKWGRGGMRRQDSARAGVLAVESTDIVLIHDAARPFISATIVRRLIDALGSSVAAAPALAVTDTIKRADAAGRVIETLDRVGLYRLQTPQAVRYDVARRAFARLEDNVEYTDDLAVVEANGETPVLVDGDPDNLKITTPADLATAREILARRTVGSAAR